MLNTLAEVGALADKVSQALKADARGQSTCTPEDRVPSITYHTAKNWAITFEIGNYALVLGTSDCSERYVVRAEELGDNGSITAELDETRGMWAFEATAGSEVASSAMCNLLQLGAVTLLRLLFPSLYGVLQLQTLIGTLIRRAAYAAYMQGHDRISQKKAEVSPLSTGKPAQPPKPTNLNTSVFSTVEEVAMFTQYMEERLGALNIAKLRIFSSCDSPQKWQIIASLPDNVGAIEVSALSGARIQVRYTAGGTVLTVDYGPERREYEYYVIVASSDLLDAATFDTCATVVDVVAYAVSAVLPGKRFPYFAAKETTAARLRGKYVDQWRKLVETATHRAYT